MSEKLYVPTVVAAAVLAVFPASAAQPESASATNKTATLPEMVVTATRDERRLQNTPYSANVLDSDFLQLERSPRTVPEALRYEPGVMIQKTSNGQGSPYIRGFTSQRTLFMIDGIRLNNAVFREGPNQYWNTVDSLALDRLEVVRGPAAVLYGSDAIGGTVNAITAGAGNLSPGSRRDSTLYYRYSSAENSNIGRVQTIAQLTDKLFLTLGYSYKDFGDVEGGKNVGQQSHTGYTEKDWDAKLQYFFSDNAYLTFAHRRINIDDAWRTHKTIYGIGWKNLKVGKELRRAFDQDRNLTYLQFHQYNIDEFISEVHAGISYQSQAEDRDRIRSRSRYDRQGFDDNTTGMFLSFKSPSSIGNLIYGLEYYHDNINSYKHKLNSIGNLTKSYIQGPVADDAAYDALGLYLQDEITLAENLQLILGGRYDYDSADADKVQDPQTGYEIAISDDWDNVAGSARLQYFPDELKQWNLFAGISQGFRAPNLSDLTRLDSARTDEIETPSPDLSPEHYLSYEIGIKSATDRLQSQVALFYTDIRDMIVRTPTGRTIDGDYEVTKKNSGDGYIGGIEIQADRLIGLGVHAIGAFTWMSGKVDTYPTSDDVMQREYIDRLMPAGGYAGLHWNSANGKLWAEAICRASAKAGKLSTRDKADTSRIPPGGTPGYAVGDIRAGINLSDRLQLSLALENITDKDYRIHGSGINEAGRNFIVSVKATF